jgi:hypothetical protein
MSNALDTEQPIVPFSHFPTTMDIAQQANSQLSM